VPGRLTIVGTGITLGVHVTPEARAAIERADEVLYLLAEPAMSLWLERLNPRARSLEHLYPLGSDRREIYQAIVEEVAARVRTGADVCLAFYGHPGVFVYPSHELVRRARAEGWHARLLPGISAEDCLFADLGVDPGLIGCLSFEASDFLLHGRRPDTSAGLVLWQIGVIGIAGAVLETSYPGVAILRDRLLDDYPPAHEVVVYEAATYPIFEPVVRRVPLAGLAEAEIPTMATLWVPPAGRPQVDAAMAQRLDALGHPM
jgi:uncharacterized protein YabN with tetrapyrrole methylase and pyrophosphatase domain